MSCYLDPRHLVCLARSLVVLGTTNLTGTLALGQIPSPVVDGFGAAVSGAGDVDRDGVPDLLVGAPACDRFAPDDGQMLLFSGATGVVLQEWTGDSAGSKLGRAVGTLGDLDGDGVPDPFAAARGSVSVYSGATRQVLYRFEDCAEDPDFAWRAASLGDVNGDGFRDLGICKWHPFARDVEERDGAVFVYSGLDGKLLHALNDAPADAQLDLPRARPRFGACVAGLGDLDGDGCEDFGVGGEGVEVFSGRTGATLYRVPHGGYALVALGDQDGDGLSDFATSAVSVDLSVVSGAHGDLLHAISYAGGYMDGEGHNLANVGDLDGDGFDDLLVGRQETCCDYEGDYCVAFLFGGRWESERLGARRGARCLGHPEEWNVVAGIGDIDLDGTPDVAVGYPLSGSVRLVSGATQEDLRSLAGVTGFDGFGYELATIAGPAPLRPGSPAHVSAGTTELVIADPPHGLWIVSAANGEPRIRMSLVSASGWGLAPIADVNDDGYCDLVSMRLGPSYDGYGFRPSFLLYSGADGSVILSRDGERVQPAGDYDGDGYPDLLVEEEAEGKTWLTVRSGRSGSAIMSFVSGAGTQVRSLGDLDGDGIADLSSYRGKDVDILSGRTKRRLTSVPLPPSKGAPQIDVVLAGDLNGDGHSELAVVHGNRTTVSVHDWSGEQLYEFVTEPIRGAPSTLGDVTGDGVSDFALPGLGSVELRSGADGREVRRFRPDRARVPRLSVAPLGDIDGDGTADYAIAENRGRDPSGEPSTVTAFFGGSGRVAWRIMRGHPSESLRARGREAPPPSPGRAVAITEDGELVAVARENGAVALLDARDGTPLRELHPALVEEPWALAFSPDGNSLAGLGKAGGLRIWDLRPDHPEATELLDGLIEIEPTPWPSGQQLLWSPDSDRLLIAHSAGQFSLWKRDGELVRRWNGRRNFTDERVLWDRDGSLLLANGSAVEVLDGETGLPLPATAALRPIECGLRVETIALHPKEHLLATGHAGCLLRIWDLDSGKLIASAYHPDPVFPEKEEKVRSIAWSPAGDRLAISICSSTYVFVLDPKTLEKTWDSGFLGAHFDEGMPVVWSPDGSHLWYDYACQRGPVRWVDPSRNGTSRERAHARLPVFGGGRGVLLIEGAVHAIGVDGELRW